MTMTKYKIKVSGIGGEIFVFPITEEQFDELDVVGQIEQDYATEITSIEDFFSDESISGPYNESENLIIQVFEEDNLIWSSTEYDDFIEDGEYDYPHIGYNLLCEDYVKGSFFECEFESDSFDPTKLKLMISDVGGVRELVTGILYDDKLLENNYDNSEYISKGFSLFLSSTD